MRSIATSEISNLSILKSDVSCVCGGGGREGVSSALCVGVTHVRVYGDRCCYITVECCECQGSLANGRSIAIRIEVRTSASTNNLLPYFKINTYTLARKTI